MWCEYSVKGEERWLVQNTADFTLDARSATAHYTKMTTFALAVGNRLIGATMRMIATDFRWYADADGQWLCIRTKDAQSFLESVKQGKTYSVEIKEYRKPRSLDANAYAWVLIGKISAKMNIPKEEVYRKAIREIGGNSDTVCVMEKAADALCEGWKHNGIGWITERFPSKIDGCVNVTLYYGSSTYDSATMSRLIDYIVDDAKELGIETMTPQELARLEGYDGKI